MKVSKSEESSSDFLTVKLFTSFVNFIKTPPHALNVINLLVFTGSLVLQLLSLFYVSDTDLCTKYLVVNKTKQRNSFLNGKDIY